MSTHACRTGKCKYGHTCKYNHPKEVAVRLFGSWVVAVSMLSCVCCGNVCVVVLCVVVLCSAGPLVVGVGFMTPANFTHVACSDVSHAACSDTHHPQEELAAVAAKGEHPSRPGEVSSALALMVYGGHAVVPSQHKP